MEYTEPVDRPEEEAPQDTLDNDECPYDHASLEEFVEYENEDAPWIASVYFRCRGLSGHLFAGESDGMGGYHPVWEGA